MKLTLTNNNTLVFIFLLTTIWHSPCQAGPDHRLDPFTPPPIAENAQECRSRIPLRLGSVDAPRGGLNLSIPISPGLPGRIPLALCWEFGSHHPNQYSEPLEGEADPGSGGTFSPVGFNWRSIEEPGSSAPPTATLQLLGRTWFFFSQSALPQMPLPAFSALMAQGTANGFENDGAVHAAAALGEATTQVSRVFASDDGTAFLIHLWYEAKEGENVRRAGGRFLFLQGPNAVWGKQENPTRTIFTNLYGDRVSVSDSTHDTASGTSTVIITNERYPAHSITARLVLGSTEACPSTESRVQARFGHHATLTVSNTLGLPTTEMEGRFRSPGGFLPENLTQTADNASRTVRFDWLKGPDGVLRGRLEKLTHPDGLVEALTYTLLRDEEQDWPMVETLSTRDTSGTGNFIKISRTRTDFSHGAWDDWDRKDPVTRVAFYADPAPGTGACRTIVLTHPPASWGWGIDLRGYLYYTNAVIKQECYASCDDSNLGEPWETRVYDGWSLRSWANPAGTVIEPKDAEGTLARVAKAEQFVTAVPRRVRIYPKGLPMVTVILGHPSLSGSQDDRGPLRTDIWISAGPRPIPTLPAEVVRDTALEVPSDFAAHGSAIQARHWNSKLGALETTSEEKRMEIPSGQALRYMADSQGNLKAWAGTQTSRAESIFEANGLPSTQSWGLNDAKVTVDILPWSGSLPLPGTCIRTVRTAGTIVPAAPGHELKAGTEYRYDSSPFHWMSGARNLVDGRWTTYAVDDLGRRVLVTEPTGIQTKTAYDGWGRIRSVARMAKGAAGPVITEFQYAADGTWAVEVTRVDGHALSTRSELDAWGRTTMVTFPDGSTQRTWFDGFGQKVRQTPVMKPGQSPYGDQVWTYDPQGRLCEERDRVIGPGTGRTLARVTSHPAWIGEGIRSTFQDAEGGARSMLTDVLGQTVATTDPTGKKVRFYHDRNGYLLRTAQGDQARSWIRNDHGWLLSEAVPEQGTTLFSDFTSDGEPTIITRIGHSGSKKAQTRILLDALSRPAEIRASSPEGEIVRRLAYDHQTHLLMEVVETQPYGAFTGTFNYDDLGRLTRKTLSDGSQTFTVSRQLYDAGTVKALTFPMNSEATVTTTLDILNRPQVTSLNGSSRGQMFYDDKGAETSIARTLALGNGAATTSTWEMGQLECMTHQFSRINGGLESASWCLPDNRQVNHMGWSPGGLLLWRGPDKANSSGPDGHPLANDAFAYDAQNRLVQAKTQGVFQGEGILQVFGYDEFGNRCQSGFAYTPGVGGKQPEEVLAWKGTISPPTNQLPGILQGPAGPLTTGAVYDDFGNLRSILAVPNHLGHQSVSWDYDGALRVRREVVDGMESTFLLDSEGLRFRTNNPDGSVTYKVHGFSRELLSTFILRPARQDGPKTEQRSCPSWVSSLIHGFGQLLSEETPTGATYIQSDLVGSPNLMTDAQGALVGITKNLPFGERFGSLGAPSAGRFATHENGPDSPIFMQSRVYLPSYGRFGQPDPVQAQSIEDPETWNLYGYAGNRPTFIHDPFGLAPTQPGKKNRGRHWEWVDDIQSQAVFGPDPDEGDPDDDPDDEDVVHGPRSTDPRHGPLFLNHGVQLFPVFLWDYTPHWGPIPQKIPHTFIETPNLTRGYYPRQEYHLLSAVVTVLGEVRNDADHLRNALPTRTFWVDAATLARVEQGMNWSPQFYELNNGFWNHAYNCTGWANKVLAGSGLKSGWDGVGANPWTN